MMQKSKVFVSVSLTGMLVCALFLFQVEGVFAQVDTTPPVLSGVGPVNVIGSGAQIQWTTDDPSDSRVPYGTSPGNYTFFSI